MVPGTMDAILKIASYSFNIMLDGRVPMENYYGRPTNLEPGLLADGWCAALCQARGDWEFYVQIFYFPRWDQTEMCWLCRASSVDAAFAYTDCSMGAGWRGTCWTHETYMDHRRNNGLAIPALLLYVIGFRLECVMIDVLHTVDQGVASHIVGNVLWIAAVIKLFYGGATMKEKVARCYDHLKGWYKQTKCEYKLDGALTVERLRATSASWPKLKAKAAVTRKLALYALEIAAAMSDGTDADERIVDVCRLLVRFYQIMDSESKFPGQAARE